MQSNQSREKSREGGGGFPVQGIIALAIISLGVLAMVLKAMGLF